jgi:hypothetical protein
MPMQADAQAPKQSPKPKPPPKQAPKQSSKPATQPASKQAPQQTSKQAAPQQTSKQAPRNYSEVVAATCGAMTSAAVSALLPLSRQPQPQWQQQAHQRKAKRPQQKQQQHHQEKRWAIGVDRYTRLCHFTVSGSGLDTAGSAIEVVRRVVARVDGGESVAVVDAVRLGPASAPRYQFKVATLVQADILVRGRGQALAGTGVVLSEVLSAAEAARHTQYYADFLRLKQAGHTAQFRRARLFIDGQVWTRPPGAHAAA